MKNLFLRKFVNMQPGLSPTANLFLRSQIFANQSRVYKNRALNGTQPTVGGFQEAAGTYKCILSYPILTYPNLS